MEREDKKTIGLTDGGRRVLEKIRQLDMFADDVDIARFAMAVAIRSGAQIVDLQGVGTIWNVGSFDVNGEIRDFILSAYPDTAAPYRMIECLIDAGLQRMDKQIADTGALDLSAL